jgi:Arc/MetJ-type ribon-helix-helix transcriptional regulator
MAKEMRGEFIQSEQELRDWFIENHRKLGYVKILKNNKRNFPDFIMLRNSQQVLVELETKASHFILHKHDKKKVDEVVCIENDTHLGIPVFEIKELQFLPRLARISATVDKEIITIIEDLLEDKKYRNKSHVIEAAIHLLKEKAQSEQGSAAPRRPKGPASEKEK